jgi:hypothetical protein
MPGRPDRVRSEGRGAAFRWLGPPTSTGGGADPFAEIDSSRRADRWSRRHVSPGGLAAHWTSGRAGAGIVVSTHDLAEAERCSQAALLSEGRVVAVGTPEQIARSAPAAAFSLSGGGARLLGECVEVLPGVIASYPQGSSLRVVADPKAEESLQRLASSYSASTAGVPMRFEDAVLAFSGRRAEA